MTEPTKTNETESEGPLRLYVVCCQWGKPGDDLGTYEDSVFATSYEQATRFVWQDMYDVYPDEDEEDPDSAREAAEYEVIHCYHGSDVEALVGVVQSVLDQVPPEVRALLERGIEAGRGYYNECASGYRPPEGPKADALDDAMKGPGASIASGPKV